MQSRMSCILKKKLKKKFQKTPKKLNPKQNKKPSNKKIPYSLEYTNKTKKRKNEVQHIKPLIHSIAKTEAFTVSLWESSYTSLHLRCPQDAVNSLRFLFWFAFF